MTIEGELIYGGGICEPNFNRVEGQPDMGGELGLSVPQVVVGSSGFGGGGGGGRGRGHNGRGGRGGVAAVEVAVVAAAVADRKLPKGFGIAK